MAIEVPGGGKDATEYKKAYYSLWPKVLLGDKDEAKDGVDVELIPSFDADCFRKRRIYIGNEYVRNPEYTYDFYTLNVNNIAKAADPFFRAENNGVLKWSKTGTSPCESCASFAWKLLVAGGIENLVNKMEQSAILRSGNSEGTLYSNSSSCCSSLKNIEKVSKYTIEMAINSFIKSPDILLKIIKQAYDKDQQHIIENSEINSEKEKACCKCRIM